MSGLMRDPFDSDGEGDDLEEIAFKCLLRPDTLPHKLNKWSRDQRAGVAKKMLEGLQAERIRDAAALAQVAPAPPQNAGANNVVPVLEVQEVKLMALDPISGQMVKVSKKRLMLQKMCLQLFAHAEWNLVELSPSASPSPLPLSLQHELLSTLLCVCGVQHLLSNLRADATLGDLIDKQTPSGIFAFQVFFRWILRSICQLPLPLPVGTKAQIFSASAGGLPMLHNMGIDQTSSGIFVSSFVPIALKGLHHINSNLTESCFVPSLKSFKMSDHTLICAPEDSLLVTTKEYQTHIFFDLAYYHFCFEEYSLSSQCLQSMRELNTTQVLHDTDMKLLQGLETSLGLIDPPSPAKSKSAAAAADVSQLCLNVNEELNNLYRQSPDSKLVARNRTARIQHGLPPNYEAFKNPIEKAERATASKQQADQKTKFDLALRDSSESNKASIFRSEPSLGSIKLFDATKMTKNVNLKKKSIVTALFKETNPEKIMKGIQDLNKFGVPVKKLSVKWNLGDSCFHGYINNLGRNVMADYAFVLLVKITQLNRMGACQEAKNLYKALETSDAERNNHTLSPLIRSVLLRKLNMELTVSLDAQVVIGGDMLHPVRNTLIDLLNIPDESYNEIIENCIAALLNRSDFEFLLSITDHRRYIIPFVKALLALTTYWKLESKGLDVKLNAKIVKEYLFQPSSNGSNNSQGNNGNPSTGSKRNRDGSAAGGGSGSRSQVPTILGKIHHPDILAIIGAVVQQSYNSSLDDSNLKLVNPGLPHLPLGNMFTNFGHHETSTGIIYKLFTKCSHMDPIWLRYQAEFFFSLGHHSVALTFYIQTLVLTSGYFLKHSSSASASSSPMLGEGEDKHLYQKVIKCFIELDLNIYAAVAAQIAPEVDYSTAFKCLEERSNGDAMDGLYNSMWDITLLEYVVSMHTKRGDVTRRKIATDKIGTLDINTNNNVEILKEASLFKKAKFLRSLCLHFL